MLTNAERADVLVQALPYIQKYTGKIVVVKYGGSAMTEPSLRSMVMRDVALLRLVGVKVVLVHGGGPEITELLTRLGKRSSFVDGLRVTDAETAEVAQMVLAGKVNKGLVTLLQGIGARAIGLCGMDGGMIKARMIDEKYGYVGDVTEVDASPLKDLMEKGYIPVVSTLGVDETGRALNINADTAAARIAGELEAECLISMTDTAGVLRDVGDGETLVKVLRVGEIEGLKAEGVITGGMIPKVMCCWEAIRRGVKKVFIVDGKVPHAMLIETLTDEGLGTMVLE